MTGPTFQSPVLGLLGVWVPLEDAQAGPDLLDFEDWLGGRFTGWTMRMRTEHIVPAPGALAGAL